MPTPIIDAQLLELLRCPRDKSRLTPADGRLVDRLNRAIEAGRLLNLGGQAVAKRLDGALVRQAGDLAYAVIDAIPVLLPDEAIALDQLGS